MLKFLLTGNWSTAQVIVARVPCSRQLIPEVEFAIESAWQKAVARPGLNLFDGPMCRMELFSEALPDLHLSLSATTYKIFLGTNMANPHFADQFGPRVMANPLGVSTALLTSDGRVLLGRRNAAVAYHPNRVHPFAGCMEPADADPFITAARELSEELSLTPADITELRCTGLVADTALHQPELIFTARCSLTQSQIESRLDPTEHDSLWTVPATSDAITQAVQQDPLLTPIAVAALARCADSLG